MDIRKIKEKVEGYDEFYLKNAVGIDSDELDWLIEQAERSEQIKNVNKELSGCLNYHIKENKELKEELVKAYQDRGSMYSAGEYEWIQNRLNELKDELED